MDTERVHDSSYVFEQGELKPIPTIKWTERLVKRYSSKDKAFKEEKDYAPAGFRASVSMEFGSDWGVSVRIRRGEDEAHPHARLPLVATVQLSEGVSFDVICAHL